MKKIFILTMIVVLFILASCGKNVEVTIEQEGQPPKKAVINFPEKNLITDDETLHVEVDLGDVNLKDVAVSVEGLGSARLEGNELIYVPPEKVEEETLTRIRVVNNKDSTDSDIVSVRLMPEGKLGLADDGKTKGLVGYVHKLPENIENFPNVQNTQVYSTVVIPKLDVPNHDWEEGFPGVPDLVEWFGIEFKGRIRIGENGEYNFYLNSDDGSILYIDGEKVIDNDGLHPQEELSNTTYLTAGFHDIEIDYYQGPRWEIALELYWQRPGKEKEIIPGDYFYRGKSDLIINSLDITTENLNEDTKKVNFKIGVENIGVSMNEEEGFSVAFWPDVVEEIHDAQSDVSDNGLYESLNGLEHDNILFVDKSIELDKNGTYKAKVCVDLYKKIDEVSESNNCWEQDYEVIIGNE